MLQFYLTDSEIISLVRDAERDDDGYYIVEIPQNRLSDKRQSAPIVLAFNESAKTVACEKKSIRLSPTQYHLLKYIYEHGKAYYEELQDSVWHCKTTDTAIRCAIAKVNNRLIECGFSFELVTRKSRVTLERAA